MASATPAESDLRARAVGLPLIGSVAALILCGILEVIIVYYSQAWPRASPAILLGSRTFYVAVTMYLILLLSRADRSLSAPAWTAPAIIAVGFVLSLTIAYVAMEAFPNSGDEFGYNYVADTLLHGRVWNPSVPERVKDIFKTYYIGDHGGKRASQYPPGWPAVLALFKIVHLGPAANAFVGLAASIFLWRALRRVDAPDNVRVGLLALVTLAPCMIFNNASFFNHSMTAACLAAIIWLDLRPYSPWKYLGIGLAFSILLTVRYETFLIAGALFGLDGFLRLRLRFLKPALLAATAALPITILLLLYNWSITGSPLQTTVSWASPEITFGLNGSGVDGPHSLVRGLRHTVQWLLDWQDFASVLILPLYVVALWHRVKTRTLRWFDLLLPAIVAFFVFYPDYGGFQYGPRYWYFGYVALPVTIAAGLPNNGGLWHLWGRRLDPGRVYLAQLAAFAGFAAAYCSFLHLQTEVRRTPLRVAMSAPPQSIVLIPNMVLPYVSWQFVDPKMPFSGKDFTRNGPDGLVGPVLLGLEPEDSAETAALCRMYPERHVFRLIATSPPPEGRLQSVCNG